MNKLFSIIIPCYNVKGYADKLFESLKPTSQYDVEIILIDDCSPDGSYQVLQELFSNSGYAKVYQTEKNGGPGLARNQGILKATGDYLIFVDSDDIFDFSFLSKAESFIKEHQDADLILSPYMRIRRKKKEIIDSYQKYKDQEEVDKQTIILGSMVPFAKVFKKAIIDKYQLLFPNRFFGEDECFITYFTIHMTKAYKLDDVYYSYICNSSSITHRKDTTQDKTTVYEDLKPVYEQYFPEVLTTKFVESHLLGKAKFMYTTGVSNKEMKKWFEIENKKIPGWFNQKNIGMNGTYRKLIYKAMYKNHPFRIKMLLKIRAILN